MVFSSVTFIFYFLPVVLALYAIAPKGLRIPLLLLVSLVFYAWDEPKYLLIMLASITINYCFGLLIDRTRGKSSAKPVLALTIAADLGLLFVFKYLDFSIGIVNDVTGLGLPLKGIVLPIGISFYTFQGLSYVIDLYRGDVAVQRNPLKLGAYISFFPQLIAGPIVRYRDVSAHIDEIENGYRVPSEQFAAGIQTFVFGLAKKVLIANTAAKIADSIFNAPAQSHFAATAWLGAVCYMIQIYFDFGGYSDMAIGLGRMFGFEFLKNFDYPYISKSIREFWRRWHISLSSFFRDYLYIPLGGSRRGNTYLNLLIVFLVTGLWHGASWSFVVWGLWHGLFIIAERLVAEKKLIKFKIPDAVKTAYTLLTVLLGWVIFRADNLTYAWEYFKRMLGVGIPVNAVFKAAYYLNNYSVFIIILAAILATGLPARFAKDRLSKMKMFPAVRTIGVILLLFLCGITVMTQNYNPFIYFRF